MLCYRCIDGLPGIVLLEVLRECIALVQKAASAPEQPAKKRKLLSKKAATAPSLTQQCAPAEGAAPAGDEAAEVPDIQQKKPPKSGKAPKKKTPLPIQAAERQSEPCQTPQAEPPQVRTCGLIVS